MELKSDKHILEMMKDTKQKFDKAKKKQEAFHGKEGWSCEIVKKDNIQSCCWKLEAEGPAGSEFESRGGMNNFFLQNFMAVVKLSFEVWTPIFH